MWPEAPPPTVQVQSNWTWQLRTPTDLIEARTQLRTRLHDLPAHSPALQAADALVIAFDELTSNAMAHIGPPVLAQVHHAPEHSQHSWLVTARDDAPTQPPDPVPPHPAGGYGLHLVRALAVAVGWIAVPPTKTVWALMDMDGWD